MVLRVIREALNLFKSLRWWTVIDNALAQRNRAGIRFNQLANHRDDRRLDAPHAIGLCGHPTRRTRRAHFRTRCDGLVVECRVLNEMPFAARAERVTGSHNLEFGAAQTISERPLERLQPFQKSLPSETLPQNGQACRRLKIVLDPG